MKKSLLITGIILLALFIGFFALNSYIYNEKQAGEVDPSISSYEECVAAGYPSMESYPEQCMTPDGKHFVRVLPAGERENIAAPVTVRGMVVCLPHWDMSGPVTLECAFGLQDDGGAYYALREADPSASIISALPMDVPVEISGTLIPGSHERYRSIGTIEVEEASMSE